MRSVKTKFRYITFFSVFLLLTGLYFYNKLPTHHHINTSTHNNIIETIYREEKPSVILFIGIYSYLANREARDSIRESWLKQCLSRSKCAYRFLIQEDQDGDQPAKHSNSNNASEKLILFESNWNNNDAVKLEIFTGRNYASSLYQAVKYADPLYDFDYFLYVNDQHYICIDKLFYELPRRKETNLYWGYGYCGYAYEIQKSLTIFSANLVRELIRNPELQYSDRGTSAKGWIHELVESKRNITWYTDNKRIWNNVPRENKLSLDKQTDLCGRYIALYGVKDHGSMMTYHNIMMSQRGDEIQYEIPQTYNICETYLSSNL